MIAKSVGTRQRGSFGGVLATLGWLLLTGSLQSGFGLSQALTSPGQPTRTRGFSSDGVYAAGDIDFINQFNGNLMLNIPIGRPYQVGDGFSYSFALRSNSDVWDHVELCGVNGFLEIPRLLDDIGPGACDYVASIPSDDANAGIGWRFGFGAVRGTKGRNRTIYVDEGGGRHVFSGSPTSFTEPTGNLAYSVDGTHLRRTYVDDLTQIIEMPDGTKKTFQCQAPCDDYVRSIWRLTEWKDSLGNALIFSYQTDASSETWTMTELPAEAIALAPQRTHYARFDRVAALKPLSMRLASLDLAAADGRRAVFRLRYDEALIYRDLDHRAYGFAEVESWSPTVTARGEIRVPQLKEIVLENGSEVLESWGFKYYDEATTPSSEIYNVNFPPGASTPYRASDLLGRLRRVVLPTKGEIEYTYGGYVFPRRSCEYGGAPLRGTGIAVTRGVRTKQLYKRGGLEKDGRPWLYLSLILRPAPDPEVACSGVPSATTTTVLDPMGAATTSYFSIYRSSAPAGRWTVKEYGMPFSHEETDESLPGLPPGIGSLSTKVFDCSSPEALATFDAASGSDASLRLVLRKLLGLDTSQPSPCGAAKRVSYVKYEYEDGQCDPTQDSNCFMLNRRLKSERTVYLDDVVAGVPRFAETVSEDYDAAGHYRKTTRDGNFGSANFPSGPSPDRSVSYTAYNDLTAANPDLAGTQALLAKWILSSYSRTEVSMVTDTQAPAEAVRSAKSLFSFDPANGRLRAERRLKGDAPGPSDVLVVRERALGADGVNAGAVLLTTTTYGGDGGALPTNPGSLFAPPAASPRGTAFRVVERRRHGATEYSEYQTLSGARILQLEDNTIDAGTGLVMSARDAAGVATAYQYDLLGRLTRWTPQSDAATTYAYRSATSALPAQVEALQAGGGTEQVYLYDGQGRPSVTKERMPGAGLTKVVTEYLATGQKSWVSTPVRDVASSDPAAGVTTKTSFTYDYLGRVRESRGPDGSKTTVEYDGDRATRMKLWNVSGRSTWRAEGRDTARRTVRVAEDSVRDPAAPPGVVDNTTAVTRYAYDALGNLVLVKQGAQKRLFVYDARGFLTSRQEPELGTGGNGTMNYSNFDPMGHARSRPSGTGAADTLSFEYDGAGRLTIVKLHPSGSSAVPLKELTYYDVNCGPASRSAGKLGVSTRHNYVPSPMLPPAGGPRPTIDIVVSETYSYDNPEGRVSKRRTDVAYDGQNHSFELGLGYDGFGNPDRIEYPRCITGCGGVSGPSRSLQSIFQQGRLTDVAGFGSVSYHPNGQVRAVTHANGVIDELTDDPDGMLRPARIRTRGALVSNGAPGGDWDSGTYVYDGVGNITAIGPDRFAYDAVNRVVDARVAGRRQTFAYDEYGNLHTIDRYESTSVARTLVRVEAGTNHLLPPTGSSLPSFRYDAYGNLAEWADPSQASSDAPFRHTYDAFSMMTELRGGAGLGKIFVYTADDERVAVIDYKAGGTIQPGRIKETWSLRGTDKQVLRDFVFDSASGWSLAKDYVHRAGKLLATIDGSNVPRHMHLDHLGTPRLVTSDTARRVSQPNYLPFGEELSSSVDGERMRFTGHERDDNSPNPASALGDLDYMHARYCQPTLGRFVSLDPIPGQVSNPQSWNRYPYAQNNPVDSIDPSGNAAVKIAPPSAHLLRFWTDEQRLFENMKNIQRATAAARGQLSKFSGPRPGGFRTGLKRLGMDLSGGRHADHIIDWQLKGSASPSVNGQALDGSVDASNGVRTRNAIKGLKVGEKITAFEFQALGPAGEAGEAAVMSSRGATSFLSKAAGGLGWFAMALDLTTSYIEHLEPLIYSESKRNSPCNCHKENPPPPFRLVPGH